MNRRLTRSRNSMIGGVAAGVAEWMNADPALVRIAWALLVPLTGGAALLAYIVAWVVVPEAPRGVDAVGVSSPTAVEGETAGDEPAPESRDVSFNLGGDRTAYLIGGGLILIGLWFLVREYLPAVRWNLIWPILLVAVGVVVLVAAMRRR